MHIFRNHSQDFISLPVNNSFSMLAKEALVCDSRSSDIFQNVQEEAKKTEEIGDECHCAVYVAFDSKPRHTVEGPSLCGKGVKRCS